MSKYIQYFFGYYEWCGNALPMMWMEEDHIPVGRNRDIVQGPTEITFEEYNGTLLTMTTKYPLQVDMTDILSKR